VQTRVLRRIVAGCSDPEIARYIPIIPAPYTDDDAHAWLSASNVRWHASRELDLAVADRGSDRLLGVISIQLRAGGSVGYWLRREARGRGVMLEALDAVVDWAAAQHGVRELTLTIHPDNVASQRVAEGAGFVRAGIVPHDPPFRDGTIDAILFLRR
jgi:RimJ/RimL family protein N-acetyltransferase